MIEAFLALTVLFLSVLFTGIIGLVMVAASSRRPRH